MTQKFQPKAKVLADSVNKSGIRLLTMEIKFHRFILPEFNTHRMFSRNAASSRAIPVQKLINKCIEANVEPLYWGKNQPGMQANEEVSDVGLCRYHWNNAREQAIKSAEMMSENGCHKEVANRLLEPFLPVTMIVSATDHFLLKEDMSAWQWFFKQRCHKDAQPEMQALAKQMQIAYESSTPSTTIVHLPFGMCGCDTVIQAIRVNAGKCARVSYLSHDGVHDIEADLALHDKLVSSEPPHLSPLEHVAVEGHSDSNFKSWVQYRSFYNL